MKKIFTVFALLVLAVVAFGQAPAGTQPQGPFYEAPYCTGSSSALTVACTGGTVYIGGLAVPVTAGTVSSLTASKSNCEAPAFSSCDIIYADDAGALHFSATIGTAQGTTNAILAYVTTNTVNTLTTVQSWRSTGSPPAVGSTTGSGASVLANTPTLITPVLGAATGTSIALGGGTALTTTNQTGTGSLVLATSPTLVTPVIGAATGTSLALTGQVDGTIPITITTGATANLGSTYNTGLTLNQEGTAGTGVTYTLPATATGKFYCVANSGTTGVVNTGALTVYPPASSFVINNGVVNTVGGGGTHGVASGGAAGDEACFAAIDATHWQVLPIKGTWTSN